MLAQQVSQLEDSRLTDNVTIGDKLELVYDPDLSIAGLGKETELQKEQLKKYRQLDSQLDKLEGAIGQWNPLNRFTNLYQAFDNLCERVDQLNQGNIDLVGSKAKELNKELETLVSRFRALRNIDYDPTKVDFLYALTEKSIEQEKSIELIIVRLKAVESIHQESTNISRTFDSVDENQPEVTERL